RKTLALGLDGDALDRSRYAGSSQRLPTTEGSQATPSVTCRPGSTPDKKLNPRRACSPSQRSLTSISVATASQCSTNSGTSRALEGETEHSPFTQALLRNLKKPISIDD